MVELKVDDGALLRRIESRIAETLARGEPLRKDDDPEVLKTRLDAYRRQTAPLIHYYREKGLLKAVDGMAPIDEVTAAIDWIFQKPRAAASAHATSGKSPKAQKSHKKSAKKAVRAVGGWAKGAKKATRKAAKRPVRRAARK